MEDVLGVDVDVEWDIQCALGLLRFIYAPGNLTVWWICSTRIPDLKAV